MNKHALRKEIQAKKKLLTTTQIDDCSRRLAAQFLTLREYQAAKSIYSYLPYNQEINTYGILRCFPFK